MNFTANSFGSLICFLIALYFGFQYCIHRRDADSTVQWSRITGDVRSVSFTESRTRRRVTYQPSVYYHFKLHGKSYTGSVISYPTPTLSYSEKLAFQKQYPEGGLVSVYYDPKFPSKSCLQAGETKALNNELWYMFGFMILAAVLPAFPSYQRNGGMYGHNSFMITPPRS